MANVAQAERCTETGLTREWLGIRELTQYAAVSERTIRAWLHRLGDPLPAVRVGTKILIRRTDFDAWLESHRLKSESAIDVDGIVEQLVRSAR
jgi:excisionase family DNA binding protein